MASYGCAITVVGREAATMLTEWLKGRGLDPNLAEEMGWMEVQGGKSGQPVLQIPYVVDGEEVAHQYRNLQAKEFRFATGAKVTLWNRDALTDSTLDDQPLVICEGACDGLACIQAGYKRTIAVPGWSKDNFDPERYEPFLQNEHLIKTAKTIVVCQHRDEAGKAMLRAISNFFNESDVKYVTWPVGCGDANDVLRDFDAETLAHVIAHAKSFDVPGGVITGFSDMPPYENRSLWKMNYEPFDDFIALRSRAMSVLTGVPGAGKTTFITWVLNQLVRECGVRVGLCLFETEPREVERQLFRMEGISSFTDTALLDRTREMLDKHFRVVHRVEDQGADHGMLWAKRIIHKLAARDGCNIIVIDPWNEIEHSPEIGENVTQYTNLALKRIREWAEHYNIHIVVVAHPKKMETGKCPQGYDVADSAAFYNKPDMGWSVNLEYNEDYGDHVKLLTWKVRSREDTGCHPGTLRMEFDPRSMVYRRAIKRTPL
jgi:twinkle protein